LRRSQSVQDALADAETLLANTPPLHDAFLAGREGRYAAANMAARDQWAEHESWAAAWRAARRAFRACPALRAAQQEEA
jgi:hypothetical protein